MNPVFRFDGDTMNLIILESVQAKAEVRRQMNIKHVYISSQTSKPMIGQFQDSLIGTYKMSLKENRMNKFNAMQLFYRCKLPVKKLNFNKSMYTGKEIINFVLEDINISRKPSSYNKSYLPYINYDKEFVNTRIVDGKLVEGILDKALIGNGQMDGLFHRYYLTYGYEVTKNIIYNMQQLSMEYVLNRGVTTTLSDCDIGAKTRKIVQQMVAGMMKKSEQLAERYYNGEIIPPQGIDRRRYYEVLQSNALHIEDDFLGPILSAVDYKTNGLFQMINTKTKGKIEHFISISSVIGQQFFEGGRGPLTFGFWRTLPYFSRYDTDPQARGFIPNSFVTQLSLPSIYWLSVDSRRNLTNIQLSTAKAGTEERNTVKTLEADIVNYTYGVKKGGSYIVQYLTGDTGFKPQEVEKIYFPTVMISNVDLAKEYKCEVKDFKNKPSGLKDALKDEYEHIEDDRKFYREIMMYFERSDGNQSTLSNNMLGPIKIDRMIETLMSEELRNDKSFLKKFNPLKAIKEIKELIKWLPMMYFNDKYEGPIADYYTENIRLIKMLIRASLCTRQLLKHKVNNDVLSVIINLIKLKLKRSLIDYGNSIGVNVATDIAEKSTQNVLNSKHNNAVAGHATNDGTRLTEISKARNKKGMANPMMLITFPVNDKVFIQEIANKIRVLCLKDFIKDRSEIIVIEPYNKFDLPITKKYRNIYEKYIKYNKIRDTSDLTPFKFIYELDVKELISKDMDTIIIKNALALAYPNIMFYHAQPNRDVTAIIGQLKTGAIDAMKKRKAFDMLRDVRTLSSKLLQTKISGIDEIQSADLVKVVRTIEQKDGSLATEAHYAVQTMGSNLRDISVMPELKDCIINTNVISEIQDIYGVEAARQKIFMELKNIVTGVNPLHLSLYADEVTLTGKHTTVDQSGVALRQPSNVLLPIGYKSPNKQLAQAALYNKYADIPNSTTGNQMLGTTPRIGTCYSIIAINDKFLDEQVTEEDEWLS